MTNRLTLFQKIRKGLSYFYYPYNKLFRSSETFEFQEKNIIIFSIYTMQHGEAKEQLKFQLLWI